MNPIQYLINKGFKITSDPNWFKRYGERELYAYGANVDSYCGGFHRAYDMVKYHGAGIPSIANATVLQGTGWNTFGWTLVLGYKDRKGRSFQVIYGHLNRNPLEYLKVGQNVKQGQIVAYQGASNNLGVSMASHLHIQFQNYQALNEWNFTCLGINPLNMDISQSSPTSNKVVQSKPPTPNVSNKTVNKNKNRGRSLTAYMSGRIDSLGAEVRKRRGNQSRGFNWNEKSGYDLKPGDVVYIFEVHNGWGRIYTGNKTGHGSNDWIYLDRLNVTEVFK